MGDLTRSSTAPSFVTKQLRSRDSSREETFEPTIAEPEPPIAATPEATFVEGRPASSLSDVSGAAATVVTLKNAISEVLGTEDRSRIPQQQKSIEESEEGPFTITFRNVTEAGVVRGEFQSTEEALQSSTVSIVLL